MITSGSPVGRRRVASAVSGAILVSGLLGVTAAPPAEAKGNLELLGSSSGPTNSVSFYGQVKKRYWVLRRITWNSTAGEVRVLIYGLAEDGSCSASLYSRVFKPSEDGAVVDLHIKGVCALGTGSM